MGREFGTDLYIALQTVIRGHHQSLRVAERIQSHVMGIMGN